jgi:hypothetical protein
MPRNTKRSHDQWGYEPNRAWGISQLLDFIGEINGPKIRTRKETSKDPRVKAVKSPRFKTVTLRANLFEEKLRALAESWEESGRDLNQLFERYPALRIQVERGRTKLLVDRSGRGHLDWEPLLSQSPTPAEEAIASFAKLVGNPFVNALAFPCKKCHKYFLKNSKRERVYCSRACGSKTTATESVKKSRVAERERAIDRARRAIEVWKLRSRRLDCKSWVRQESGLTLHWLTLREKEGSLSFRE